AQRDPERLFDETRALEISAELDRQRAARSADAVVAIEAGALREDDRDAGERDHVVHDRRLPEKSLDGRQRRPRANLATFALEALEHRGLFAADVCACPKTHFEIEALAAALNVLAEEAAGVRRFDRGIQRAMGVRIFDPQVDVTPCRADGDSRD